MIKSQDQDEFIAVRVQDPRVQNEGSWNSYVDFKIFLHTNSKAFTAKTSCVRRRYSEFVWLRKKLQKNAGLVPVPELPSKSFFFSFNNEDFIEKRRKGLQYFLDKVVHMLVCLSDSQLHLFLQTQLPVSHIQDCVQGLTPYTVTDAILTYASSNLGWAQEQDGDTQEQCPTPVPYESMESPSPHMPSSQYGPPHSLTASGAAAASTAAAAAAAAAVSDSVTVDIHDVNLVELKADTQRKTPDPAGDCHMKAIVEVHTEDADLTIVEQEDAVIMGKASERTQQNRGGYEEAALEAVDQVETLLTEVGLGEGIVTDQHQEVTLEAIYEETSGQGSFLIEQNEMEKVTLEVSDEDTLNVEQEGSCLNSASDNESSLLEPSVVPQSLADHEGLQDKSETNIVENGPVEEHHEDQSQSEEGEVETIPDGEERSAQADMDGSACVEKADQEDTIDKVLQSVDTSSLEHCEEESKINGVLSNGHTSDSSVMSAIEDSTEEASDCVLGKVISANMIDTVVSDSNEDHAENLEDSLEGCDPKDQICRDQIGQPYTDLSTAQSEGTEGYPHGDASEEQVDGLINHIEVTP